MPKKDTTNNITQTDNIELKKEVLKIPRRFGSKKLSIIILVVLAVLGAYGSWHFYSKYQAVLKNPNLEAQKETETLVLAVGKLMELPTDETPTVATISDKEKLKDQPFFKAAENGDRLLAYNKAMIAILFRPSTNKIINVAPINTNQPQNLLKGKEQIIPAPASLHIAYYNGTETVGLSGLAEKTVKEKYPTWQTIAFTYASKKDYKETLVIDLSGRHSQEASNLADLLGGKTGSLPQGETAPDADILIISGK